MGCFIFAQYSAQNVKHRVLHILFDDTNYVE